jgi:hypothetical protein
LRVNGMSPFWSAGDCAISNLQEAHAILTVMASAYRESNGEGVHTMNPDILAAALEGAASLVALGLHHRSVAEAEEARHD